jgi:hypothetical protein
VIRYSVSRAQLRARIDEAHPSWSKRAAERTTKFRKLRRYEESSSIWSEVKDVFVVAQSNKCVFCERQFENPEYGLIEYDVEHFRPKSSVRPWPDSSQHGLSYDFKTGQAASGYYWLAYEPSNYAASCKNCNTPLKSNYFPIAAKRAKRLSSWGTLRAEKAFLCYPLGDLDDDPEDLVTFIATTAIPASSDSDKKRRALVIIDFFELNKRQYLHHQRARQIVLLGNSLAEIQRGTATAGDHNVVAKCTDGSMPHAACARAFRRLWDSDNGLAREILEKCKLNV